MALSSEFRLTENITDTFAKIFPFNDLLLFFIHLQFWECCCLNAICCIRSIAMHTYWRGFIIEKIQSNQHSLFLTCPQWETITDTVITSYIALIFSHDLKPRVTMSQPSSWYLIIRAVWSFLLLRLRPSYRDVPPTEELHSEPRGRLLLRLCGCSWNRPCVSNSVTMKRPAGLRRILLHPIRPIGSHANGSL